MHNLNTPIKVGRKKPASQFLVRTLMVGALMGGVCFVNVAPASAQTAPAPDPKPEPLTRLYLGSQPVYLTNGNIILIDWYLNLLTGKLESELGDIVTPPPLIRNPNEPVPVD